MLAFDPKFTNNIALAVGPYGNVDPYSTTAANNGLPNPLGAMYYLSPGDGILPTTGNGKGAGMWVKYVRYLSTDTTAVKAGPAPVYWTDATYTQVTDLQSEGLLTTANSIAGWLLPNTTTLGTGFTITVLNNSGNGSGVFICLAGFIPNAFVGSGTVGQYLTGSGTAWTPTGTAVGTFPPGKLIGIQLTSATSNLANVEAVTGSLF